MTLNKEMAYSMRPLFLLREWSFSLQTDLSRERQLDIWDLRDSTDILLEYLTGPYASIYVQSLN
jgi:hypothetical protein